MFPTILLLVAQVIGNISNQFLIGHRSGWKSNRIISVASPTKFLGWKCGC